MRGLATKLLRHSATLSAPEGVTGWHERFGHEDVELTRVHLQRDAGLLSAHLGGDVYDMETQPKAELWYDPRQSRPRGLDFVELQTLAENAGTWLRVTWQGVEYRVQGVDELSDGAGGVHHYRLELV